MSATNRRRFLQRVAAAAPGAVLSKYLPADAIQNPAQPSIKSAGPSRPIGITQLSRFIDPLPIPQLLKPHAVRNDRTTYRMRMLEFSRRLHSELPPTHLWGYEAQVPGPTLEAFRDHPIDIRWENHLPAQHLFGVDPHIHGAMPPAPAVRTVPHLHGSRTASRSDGLPESWFLPGSSALYSYPNGQSAATLWYHDHALGITRLNVYAGLSGFFLLRDPAERAMDLPSGEFELPLLLQDRTIDQRGQLVYAPSFEDGSVPPAGVWAPEFFGELPLVNGSIYPYLEVEPRPYRLRLLNGANSRFFNLYFNLAKRPTDIPALVAFHQIGSDGGFLPHPAELQSLLLGPAERADLILDFSKLAGKTLSLSNNAHTPFPGWSFSTVQYQPLEELMQFRVTRPLTRPQKSFAMSPRTPFVALDQSASIATRDFVLAERVDAAGKSLGVRINGKGYDDPVTESVRLGTTEIWRFINTTDDAHPMHLHLVQFQILERQGFDIPAFSQGSLKLVGPPRSPAANESGWKDTAVVRPTEVLSILVRFEGFTGRYIFHCHMLEHEDNDMMRPYEVVPA